MNTVKPYIRGQSLDPLIRPLVQALNKLPGCRTFASCQGHPDDNDNNNASWVNFTVTLTKFDQFMSKCSKLSINRHSIVGEGFGVSVRFSIFPSEFSESGKSIHGNITIEYCDEPLNRERHINELAQILEE